MPRVLNAQPQAQTAAVRVAGQKWSHVAARTHQAWQDRADFFSDNLGLVRFSNGLLAQAGARCILTVEKLVDPIGDIWEPIDERLDRVPAEVLRQYKGKYHETPGDLVAAQIWHYKSRGSAWLTVAADPDGGLDWGIRSDRAMDFRTHDVRVMDLPGGSIADGTAFILPREQVVRLWQPDPTWPLYATSHMKGVIADCERYWALARRIRREAESVLMNGLLFTPDYAHPPRRTSGDLSPDDQLSKFDEDLYRIAEMAWHDDDSVAAIAPLSVHYGSPNNSRDPMAPTYVYPGRVLDPNGIKYREEAAENIARGLDLPTQLAIGGAGMTKQGAGGHWASWLLEESFVKTAISPTMDKVTHADLTAAMFRPTLRKLAEQGAWNGNENLYRVGYDPTPIIVHPDRGATAITMYGAGLLRSLPVLEANGFNPSDAPSAEELAQIIESLRGIHGRQAEPITLTTGPLGLAQDQGISGPGAQGLTAVGPSNVRELPPGSPTMAALSSALTPHATEVEAWLDDAWVPV